MAAGMFAGSLTNTPALANVLEYMKLSGVHPAATIMKIILAQIILTSF
jgi:uncharacterized transporter YbjL